MARTDFENHKPYHIPSSFTGTLVVASVWAHHGHTLNTGPERTVFSKRHVFIAVARVH